MGLSVKDGFSFNLGGKLVKPFLLVAAIDCAVAGMQASGQEYLEDTGQVPEDGLNTAMTFIKYAAWENPKWVIENIAEFVTEPE